MATVTVSGGDSIGEIDSCAYCDRTRETNGEVVLRVVTADSHSVSLKAMRRFTKDPRSQSLLVTILGFAVVIAAYVLLLGLFPGFRSLPQVALFIVIVALPLVARPIWKSIKIPYRKESFQLPLCAFHHASPEKATIMLLKWPARILVPLLGVALVAYFIGSVSGWFDWFDGLLVLGGSAMLPVPFWFGASIYIHWSKFRFAVRTSENNTELWHCSKRFRDAVENRRRQSRYAKNSRKTPKRDGLA